MFLRVLANLPISLRVDFDLAITIASAVMKFSLEFKGKEMGSVEVSYRE